MTAPRLAVLAVLADHPHAAADVVARMPREQLGRVSTQAVHDVLAACAEAGLVRRIEPAGSPARFEDSVTLKSPRVLLVSHDPTASEEHILRAALHCTANSPSLERKPG